MSLQSIGEKTLDDEQAADRQDAGKLPPYWKHPAIVTPFLLALLMGVLSMRNVTCGNAVYSDSARHAMNGAMIYDFLRSGEYGDPVQFAKDYFQTYPATSLPYHAPLLPMIEALLYPVTGVNLVTARAIVAIFTALMAFTLYKFVRHSYHSSWLAVTCVLMCFALPICHILTTDVMLEIPSMAVALVAMYQLRDIGDRYTLRRSLAFALFAGIAVWTKQHTVFLGVVPFAFVLISGKWSLLLRKEIWISSAVFGVFCIGMFLLHKTFLHGGFAKQFPANAEYAEVVIVRNFKFYSEWIVKMLHPALAILVAASLIGLVVQKILGRNYQGATDLFLAWAVAAVAVPLWANQYDERYVYYAIPALATLGCIGMHILLESFSKQYGPICLAAVTGIVFLISLQAPTSYLTGPAQVAELVVKEAPKRVLYCGRTDGAFVFAMRCLDSGHEPIRTIRGDKVPRESFQRDKFPEFIKDYGIELVVIEQIDIEAPWEALIEAPVEAMQLISQVELKSRPYTSWNGKLFAYRLPPSSGEVKVITPEIFRIRQD